MGPKADGRPKKPITMWGNWEIIWVGTKRMCELVLLTDKGTTGRDFGGEVKEKTGGNQKVGFVEI
jgi:hypothetical protein